MHRRRDWAPGLMTLELEAEPVSFEAGQFFNLGLELAEGLVRRAYSAASAPNAAPEFFVAQVDDGEFSPALFALKPGDSIWLEKKPQGFFTLRYLPPAKDLWLVATGTGLGPFISMLRDAEIFERCERVILVHGVRDGSQLAYQEELAALALSRPLRLVTCMSRAAAPSALEGRVTQMLTSGALEAYAAQAITREHSHFLLCGNPAMISEMTELLKARGLTKHRVRKPGNITMEKYW